MNTAAIAIITLGTLLFYCRRSLRYFRYFQQEEYDGYRFAQWFARNRAFDRRGSIIALTSAVLLWTSGISEVIVSPIAAAMLVLLAFIEENPCTSGKVRMNMTQRATRIWHLSIALYAVFTVGIAALCAGRMDASDFWLVAVGLIQTCPIWPVAANNLLRPVEARVQRKFISEAKAKLGSIEPYVIGITGSYGKTSSKVLLCQLLNSAVGPTFCTPGSINTVMGITRQIRESMESGTRYAVIEMAAYRRGSISRLCDLTPPKAGLITNIGIMHLERFGSPENVYLAKSELAEAVPDNGILVCNGDNEGARRMAGEYPKKTTLLYGMNAEAADLDCYASDLQASEQGTSFRIHWRGAEYAAFTALLGAPSISNILGGFTMACALGADPEYAVALIRTLHPEKHRLHVSRDAHGLWLDDSYNSNPVGFAAALDVLKDLPGSKKILVTPGMVELGESEYEENAEAAAKASEICDVIVVVGPTNRDAWMAGFEKLSTPEDRYVFLDTRDQAFAYLDSIRAKGDVVLVENDLPDLYEQRPLF